MTMRSYLEKWAKDTPKALAMKYWDGKTWAKKTWGEYYQGVREIAEGYGSRFHLIPRQDNAAIILQNSPTWMEAYLAVAGTGVSVVPIDPKLHNDEVAYILNDAQVKVVTTDTAHLKMFIQIAKELPHLQAVIVTDGKIFDGQKLDGRIDVIEYKHLRIAGGGEWYDNHKAEKGDVTSIIYTSGTTGKPKGAMLTHDNFIQDMILALKVFGARVDYRDSLFIVLPLFHAFSFATNFVLPLILGCKMYFMQSLRTVGQDIHDLRPTVLMAVPLLAEKLYDKIQDNLKKSKFAQFMLKMGLRGPLMHAVKLRLGGKLRFIITGGAPCPRVVLESFNAMHIRFLEGYGLTECSPVVSITPPEVKEIGTIGLPLAGIEVRLADKNDMGVGELQVKGPIVMKGYFHKEAETKEAFDGEWLKTGDLASMDEKGLITIRGRKKALIVNREGKNIYPEEVEICIAKDPVVQDVVVVGYTQGEDPGEKVGTIVFPSEDWFKENYGGKMPEWDEVEKVTIKRVQEQCSELADYKRIRKVVVWKEPLERTSIGKVRRVTYKGKIDE